ncbi:hypothetical protein BGZ80_009093, partial [Entomortierella chlamydospora]
MRQEDKENIPTLKAGRPVKVSRWTRAHLASQMAMGKIIKLKDAQEYVQGMGEGPVTKRTIKNYLHAMGVKTKRKPEAPMLTESQVAARLKFAKDHIHWSVDQWEN